MFEQGFEPDQPKKHRQGATHIYKHPVITKFSMQIK